MWPRRPGLSPGPVLVEFVMYKVTLWQVFLLVSSLVSCQCNFIIAPDLFISKPRSVILAIDSVVKQWSEKASVRMSSKARFGPSESLMYRSSVTPLIRDLWGSHVWSTALISNSWTVAVTLGFTGQSAGHTCSETAECFTHSYFWWRSRIRIVPTLSHYEWIYPPSPPPEHKNPTAARYYYGCVSTSVFVAPQIVARLSTSLLTVGLFPLCRASESEELETLLSVLSPPSLAPHLTRHRH
jgi:hypothetical protein